jgi:hypothetical protein
MTEGMIEIQKVAGFDAMNFFVAKLPAVDAPARVKKLIRTKIIVSAIPHPFPFRR